MALTMPRTWKAALAPFLAGIPQRVGFAGEARFILLNDVRFGERKLPRMVDRCAMLALPRGASATARMAAAGARGSRLGDRRLAHTPRLWPTTAASWRSRPARLARRSAGPRPLTRRLPASYGRRLCGLGLGRPRRKVLGDGNHRRQRRSRSHRQGFARCHPRAWRRAPWRCRTIPVCSMSPPRSARRRSGFSARQAHGTGRRSIRSPRRSRPRVELLAAGPATSRSAGWSTTAACATSACDAGFAAATRWRGWRRRPGGTTDWPHNALYSTNQRIAAESRTIRVSANDGLGYRRSRLYRQSHGVWSLSMPASASSFSTICPPAFAGPYAGRPRLSSATPVISRWSPASSASTYRGDHSFRRLRRRSRFGARSARLLPQQHRQFPRADRVRGESNGVKSFHFFLDRRGLRQSGRNSGERKCTDAADLAVRLVEIDDAK